MQTLYIMQGVPGSGKSTIAKHLENGNNSLISGCFVKLFSTDDYHYENGVYVFKPDKLAAFHLLNLERSRKALDEGFSVIVDNTNIQRWCCKPYVEYAHSKGIPVVFIRIEGNFPNVHGVPPEAIERMRGQMEDLTLESVLSS